MKKALLIAATAAALAGCSQTGKQGAADKQARAGKSVIVYYSQTGATKVVAEALQRTTGADMELIEAVNPYGGDFSQTIKRCKDEIDSGTLVAIKPLKINIAEYDTIYVGYPVWFGTFAPPMGTFLKTANLEGKVVVPFCTFGSGGLTNTVASLKADLTKSTVLDGFGIRNARLDALDKELPQYLINAGIKPGTPVVLPAFSDQVDVTDADKAIFDAACGDYPMSLGTPLSVGSRKIDGGTEYLFAVKPDDPNTPAIVDRIHVVVSDSAGVKPEFTLVER